jgi:homotetrameric cytidine deaminase
VAWKTDDPAVAELLAAAAAARGGAYAPYSRYRVGAALRLTDGRVVAGCNVENASYGLSLCAERVAVFRAVAEAGLGQQAGPGLAALALVLDGSPPATPCGACRQVLAEFAGPELPIYCASPAGDAAAYTLGGLLPAAFRLAQP